MPASPRSTSVRQPPSPPPRPPPRAPPPRPPAASSAAAACGHRLPVEGELVHLRLTRRVGARRHVRRRRWPWLRPGRLRRSKGRAALVLRHPHHHDPRGPRRTAARAGAAACVPPPRRRRPQPPPPPPPRTWPPPPQQLAAELVVLGARPPSLELGAPPRLPPPRRATVRSPRRRRLLVAPVLAPDGAVPPLALAARGPAHSSRATSGTARAPRVRRRLVDDLVEDRAVGVDLDRERGSAPGASTAAIRSNDACTELPVTRKAACGQRETVLAARRARVLEQQPRRGGAAVAFCSRARKTSAAGTDARLGCMAECARWPPQQITS